MAPGLRPPPTTHAMVLSSPYPNTTFPTLSLPPSLGGHLVPAIPATEIHTRQCSRPPAGSEQAPSLHIPLPSLWDPHSPLFRESGPWPVPAKEQNHTVNILLALFRRPDSETISAKEVPGVITLSALLLQILHSLRWTQEVTSGNQGVWA